MTYREFIRDDIFYIIEVNVNQECLYVFTKRVALHFPDMAKKFAHKRSASRYYKDSEFENMKCPYRIVAYNKRKDRIIEEK